jgi:hypothetical protein
MTQLAKIANIVSGLRKLAGHTVYAFGVKDIAKLYGKAKSFGVITAYRSEYSKSQNKARMQEMLMTLRETGLHVYEPQKSEWDGVKERSIIVPNVPFDLMIALSKKYAQQAFIYKDPSGSIGIYYMDGHAEMAYDEGRMPISLSTDTKKEYSRGRSFSFSLKLVPHEFQHHGSPITQAEVAEVLKKVG